MRNKIDKSALLARRQAVVDAVIATRKEMNLRYGYNRLIHACRDPELKHLFGEQESQWFDALNGSDYNQIKIQGIGMIKGYQALEKHAVEVGIAPLPETQMEGVMPNGKLFAIVKSHDQYVKAEDDDRIIEVYDMQVVGKLLEENFPDITELVVHIPGSVAVDIRNIEDETDPEDELPF